MHLMYGRNFGARQLIRNKIKIKTTFPPLEVLGQTRTKERENKILLKARYKPSFILSFSPSISRPSHTHPLKYGKTHPKKKISKKKGRRKEKEDEGKANKLNIFIKNKSNPCINP